MPNSITTQALKTLMQTENPPIIIDVRRLQAYQENPNIIPGATYKLHEDVAIWAKELPTNSVIVAYCVHGHQVSQNVVSELEKQGFNAVYLAGGIAQWQEDGETTIVGEPLKI